jgi:hypothetical protein
MRVIKDLASTYVSIVWTAYDLNYVILLNRYDVIWIFRYENVKQPYTAYRTGPSFACACIRTFTIFLNYDLNSLK